MNNRQGGQGGRRRGRGGQRPQGMPGNSGGGGRDNRQRGNAAQLLEKYKGLARDAQLAGDRVQTEYYLQFADHYFRVLSESRSRFEEQRRGRDDFDDEEELDEDTLEADGDDGQPEVRQDTRQDRRRERGEGDGEGRRERYARDDRGERPAREDRGERRERRDRFNGRDRQDTAEPAEEPRIALDTLPPAIGIVEDSSDAEPAAEQEEAPRPRRRTRRPRAAEGGEEIAPAA